MGQDNRALLSTVANQPWERKRRALGAAKDSVELTMSFENAPCCTSLDGAMIAPLRQPLTLMMDEFTRRADLP